jgi:AcrR family transcriptional regulator
MAKRTLYARYGDKVALFRAAVGLAIDRFAVSQEELAATARDDIEETLMAFAWLRIEQVMTPNGLKLQRIINAESHRFPDILTESYEFGAGSSVRYLAGVLARETEAGRLAVPAPERAAVVFLSMVVGGPVRTIVIGNPLSRDEIDERLRYAVRLFLDGARARLELEPADLAHAGAGQGVDQVPVARAGGGRQVTLGPRGEVAGGRRMFPVAGHDIGDRHRVADRIGPSENRAFEYPGGLGEDGLDLSQAHVLAGHLNHVVAPPHEAQRLAIGPAHDHIAGVEPGCAVALLEHMARRGRVVKVLEEQVLAGHSSQHQFPRLARLRGAPGLWVLQQNGPACDRRADRVVAVRL